MHFEAFPFYKAFSRLDTFLISKTLLHREIKKVGVYTPYQYILLFYLPKSPALFKFLFLRGTFLRKQKKNNH